MRLLQALWYHMVTQKKMILIFSMILPKYLIIIYFKWIYDILLIFLKKK